MYAPEDALIDLARMAGSFMVTLVEHRSIDTVSESDSMKSAIEELTKCVLTHVNIPILVLTRTSQRYEQGSRSRQKDFFSKFADALSP